VLQTAAKLNWNRGRPRTIIATFALILIAFNTSATLLLNELNPALRDPEYGGRITRLKSRLAENPQRPLVLIVGSSRTAMGVRPGEWEAIRTSKAGTPDPLIFNLSMIGGGPILELIVIQRAIADGIRPVAIWLEYWPPLMNEERDDAGCVTIDRLGSKDRAILYDYCRNPGSIDRELQSDRMNPIYFSRHRLLSQLFPRWIPTNARVDWMWSDIDSWGWKPGCDFQPGPSKSRSILVSQARDVFANRFEKYQIDPSKDRALREAIALARKSGIEIGLIFMPESSEFRNWYPAAVEDAARQHLQRLTRDLGIQVIDARDWMDDGLFSDGFHLTRIGAKEFTRKLSPVIAASR
jgi:hypothetical protein